MKIDLQIQNKMIEEIVKEYKLAVLQGGLDKTRRINVKPFQKIQITDRKFEIIEISSENITKENKENIFELTKSHENKEKTILVENKKILIKTPYVNRKSFRIEEFIVFFENLYREENIIGQKHFKLIIKLIIETLPKVHFINFIRKFIFFLKI